jgi:hypothetical protein
VIRVFNTFDKKRGRKANYPESVEICADAKALSAGHARANNKGFALYSYYLSPIYTLRTYIY